MGFIWHPRGGPNARGAKGPLKRAVVRLVTPGTVTEEALLEAGRPNFLAAIAEASGAFGLAWLDISTGSFETQACDAGGLAALLHRVDPVELLAPDGLDVRGFTARRIAAAGLAVPLPGAAGPARDGRLRDRA